MSTEKRGRTHRFPGELGPTAMRLHGGVPADGACAPPDLREAFEAIKSGDCSWA